jgi:hypothetical protein
MSSLSRAFLRAVLLFFFAVGPAAAISHTEFCANNPLFWEQCYPAHDAAENWLYTDVSGTYGRTHLEQVSHGTPYGFWGYMNQEYRVPFVSWDETTQTIYSA